MIRTRVANKRYLIATAIVLTITDRYQKKKISDQTIDLHNKKVCL